MAAIFSKKITAVLMVTAMALASGVVTAASLGINTSPSQATLQFSVGVHDTTCSASLSSPVVDFGNIPRSGFTGKGSVGKTQTLEIKLTDCGIVAYRFGLTFTGPGCNEDFFSMQSAGTDNTRGNLENPDAEGSTKGVGIRLYGLRDEYSEIPIACVDHSSYLNNEDFYMNGMSMDYLTTYDEGRPTDTTLPMRAEVVQTGENPPTLGKLNTAGTLVVVYY